MIDFTLTEENRLVRDAARAFVEAEILPNVREWDEKGEVHREIFAKMAELGFLGGADPGALRRRGGWTMCRSRCCARSSSARLGDAPKLASALMKGKYGVRTAASHAPYRTRTPSSAAR